MTNETSDNTSSFCFYPLIAAQECDMSLAQIVWLVQGVTMRLLDEAAAALDYPEAQAATTELMQACTALLTFHFPTQDLQLRSLKVLASLDDPQDDTELASPLDLMMQQCYAGIRHIKDRDGAWLWKKTDLLGPLGWCSPAVAPYLRYRRQPLAMRKHAIACVFDICRFYEKHPDVFEHCMREFVCNDEERMREQ